MVEHFTVATPGRGLHEITAKVQAAVGKSGIEEGLLPDGDPFYRHDAEGPDDMPGHIKAALTATSVSIPVSGGALALGTWQGVYLWEHRARGSRREIVLHIGR
jgi:thiamine phosphate synthase YjbQ (UPF0047 family)